MQSTFRELTAEELMLVAGGATDGSTITVTGPGTGGGWGDGGPPSDPWGPGGPPNEPIDYGGGGGGGGLGDGEGQHYTLADVNHDGKTDEHFYQGEDGKLYYSIKNASGEQTIYPVTKLSGSVGNSDTVTSGFGATGGVPMANFSYTENASSGKVDFEIDPAGARRVQ